MYELYCKFRDRKGYTDADVARITGINKSTFSDWKNGRSNPATLKMIKIADCLDVPIEYFSVNDDDLYTCPDCGLTYLRSCNDDVYEHKIQHEKWQKAETLFGTLYCDSAVNEKMKAKYRAKRSDINRSIDERVRDETEVLRCLFSRSVIANDFSLNHVSFEKYAAMMLNTKSYRNQLGDDLSSALIKKYGITPGISEKESIYYVKKAPETIAAHKDNEEFTEDELKKIEDYKRLLLAARKKG